MYRILIILYAMHWMHVDRFYISNCQYNVNGLIFITKNRFDVCVVLYIVVAVFMLLEFFCSFFVISFAVWYSHCNHQLLPYLNCWYMKRGIFGNFQCRPKVWFGIWRLCVYFDGYNFFVCPFHQFLRHSMD